MPRETRNKPSVVSSTENQQACGKQQQLIQPHARNIVLLCLSDQSKIPSAFGHDLARLVVAGSHTVSCAFLTTIKMPGHTADCCILSVVAETVVTTWPLKSSWVHRRHCLGSNRSPVTCASGNRHFSRDRMTWFDTYGSLTTVRHEVCLDHSIPLSANIISVRRPCSTSENRVAMVAQSARPKITVWVFIYLKLVQGP